MGCKAVVIVMTIAIGIRNDSRKYVFLDLASFSMHINSMFTVKFEKIYAKKLF